MVGVVFTTTGDDFLDGIVVPVFVCETAIADRTRLSSVMIENGML
jgi:hypothetical protein